MSEVENTLDFQVGNRPTQAQETLIGRMQRRGRAHARRTTSQ